MFSPVRIIFHLTVLYVLESYYRQLTQGEMLMQLSAT